MPPTLFDWREALHPRGWHGRFKDVPEWLQVRRSVLGKSYDTQQKYSWFSKSRDKRLYVQDRKHVHDSIIGDFIGAAAHGQKPLGSPTVTLLAGGPGSGKDFVLNHGDLDVPNGVHVDPDKIKELIPEYEQMRQAGDWEAALRVHDESVDIGKRLQKEAAKQGFNVLVNGSGAAPSGEFSAVVHKWKSAGYKVRLVLVNASLDVARARNDSRERRVPQDKMRSSHRTISRRLPEMLASNVDQLEIWQNDDVPTKIAERVNKQLVVYDDVAYDSLWSKAN